MPEPLWRGNGVRSGAGRDIGHGRKARPCAGKPFAGADYVKGKAPKIHYPAPGEIVAAGRTTEVIWDLADTPAPTVTLLSSFDDRATWKIEAEDIVNTGHYPWAVPAVTTRRARLAVQMIYETDETDETDETGVVPESEFSRRATPSRSPAPPAWRAARPA